MDNKPGDEFFDRPPEAGKSGNRVPNPTPPWLWMLLIALFALIFWQFAPKNEVSVSYAPWFLDQVESGNIRSLAISGLEVHGEVRQPRSYLPPGTTATHLVKKFTTYFPSEQSIEPVVQTLRKQSKAGTGKIEPVRIDVSPPQTANGLVWITLLLPTFVIIALIYFMSRKARRG
jgi:cell division protease FtsH